MATYYQGNSEIQVGGGNGGDGLQTLILMNPGYLGYSENQQPQHHEGSNFVFLNSNNHGNNSLSLPHAPPNNPTHQLVGVPLTATGSSATAQENQHAVSALHGYSLYSPNNVDFTAREMSRAQQGGLSLSLSNRQPGYDLRGSGVLLSSKYLKATQEILDEVVSVGKVEKSEKLKGANGQNKNNGELSMGEDGNHENSESGREGNFKRSAELSTSEKQEIQMKKSKLVNMLDEVEQRYRQYHHQMQIVISWFEQAAGIGSAKTYTSLALKTISKQFRCLKDAILGQIKAASKSLGEDDDFCRKTEGSRLKFVDNHLRQQRALQQLGMVQHNAWRPQRGLPERAVSVLRAWLFEHFLHPYPKDSDKIILAKQTGLTRSQVSNWFINARVRLWKPMVEEMYAEEMNGQEKNNPSSEDNNKTKKSENDDSISKATTSQDAPSPSFVSKETEMETFSHGISKKLRPPPSLNMESESNNEHDDQMAMKFDNEKQGRDGFSFMGGPTNLMGGFGTYSMGELGRFGTDQFPVPYSGNGVSLTLGLPHCENLSMSGNHQSFLQNHPGMQVGRGVEMEENDFGNVNAPPTSTHPTNVYDNLDIQNRKRFSAQLLSDFVT